MYGSIKHLDLFSGIGGFALAADRVFGEVEHTFCEIEPFCQEVLKKHWPEAQIYGDIRSLTNPPSQRPSGREQDGTREPTSMSRPFILTGGFPCQPFSQAGRRRGAEDDRFLWPEMLRVIREFSPLWVIAENVRGLLTQGGGVVFETVCADLEAAGYEAQPLIIPAVAVGAPHRRDRVWFVAHRTDGRRGGRSIDGWAVQERAVLPPKQTDGGKVRNKAQRRDTDDSDASNASRKQAHPAKPTRFHSQSTSESWRENWLEVATRLCRVDDGLPKRMDRNPRLKALGNAIVPAVAEEIMRTLII